ncbi:transcriptional regulator moxR1 [Mycolicibacterium aurum]|uniref:Transcriptional regulator moxR1 n=1 Tax=Mycolicibacterium aurum TaxID=1791 RepID=A0A448IMA7_MYCAU|nr:DUF58 domain-containing protein [Mycolicibacterium aurum]VEG53560.1 transcriptional regulator moxR1 [Mycolicibacterium aurum]
MTGAGGHPWRALDLRVRRRVDSLMAGDYEGLRLGVGSEREELSRYQPGDDVRRIDWNITARAGGPHVWRPRADNRLDTWVMVDTTPSMAFGTVADEKRDLAARIVAAIGLLTDAPGNTLGLATFGADGVRWHRPDRARMAGVRAGQTLLRGGPRTGAGSPALADAVAALGARRGGPGLRVVISDFLDPGGHHRPPFDWQAPLRRLAARHDVIAVEILDPRELELPDVGAVVFVDPESGRQRQVWTSDSRVRRRYRTAAAEHRDAVAGAISASGAEHLRASTAGDWVRDLASFLRERQRTLRRAARSRNRARR